MWTSWRAIFQFTIRTHVYLGIDALKQSDLQIKGNLPRKQPGRQSAFLCWYVSPPAVSLSAEKIRNLELGPHRTELKPVLYLCYVFYLIM